MSTTKRRSFYGLNPLYATIGATDLAASKLREIGAAAKGESLTDAAAVAGSTVRRDLAHLARGARQLPVLAVNEALDVMVRGQEQFSELAERGERVAKRRPHVGNDDDLLHRAGRRVAAGQAVAKDKVAAGQAAASKAAHNAADRTRDAAQHSFTAARGQADEVVEAVSHLGRSGRGGAQTLLRRGSVARPVRGVARPTGAAEEAETPRPKPRRPRVSATPAGSGVEAGASVTRAKKSEESPAKRVAKKSTVAGTRPAPGSAKKVAKKSAPRRAAAPVTATSPAGVSVTPAPATATPAPAAPATASPKAGKSAPSPVPAAPATATPKADKPADN